jgi:hypothetical protein
MILPTLPVKRNYLNVKKNNPAVASCHLCSSRAPIRPSLISPFLFRPNDFVFPPPISRRSSKLV